MPTVADLMAFGTDARKAFMQGNSAVTLAVSGATQAAGATIQPGTNLVLITPATTTAVVATFSTAWSLGTPVYVLNAGTVSGTVYCPVSGTLNAVTNGSLALSTARSAIFVQTTAGQWWSIPATAQ